MPAMYLFGQNGKMAVGHRPSPQIEVPRPMMLSVMRAFAKAVANAEPHTAMHQDETARFAVLLARRLGLSATSVRLIRLGALLHDIGKIGIPPSLLLRPGPLSAAEFALVKEHPRLGWEIVSEIEFAVPVATVIHQHHERLDGSGYPGGLGEGAIMPESLVVAVADMAHAMMSRRAYHAGMNQATVIRILESDRGSRLPADCVDVAVDLLRCERLWRASSLQ